MSKDLVTKKSLPEAPKKTIVRTYDKEAIINGCGFMKHCDESGISPLDSDEFEAFVSVARHFDHHKEYIHSKVKMRLNGSYDTYKKLVDAQIEMQNATDNAPVTCEEVLEFKKCGDDVCAKGSVYSPLFIVSKKHIKTEKTHFRNVTYNNKDGSIIVSKSPPNYDDLAAFADRDWGYLNIGETGCTYLYDPEKKHWNMWNRGQIESFIETYLRPGPNNSQAAEFFGKIRRTNMFSQEDLDASVEGLLNLKNGVLDMKTKEFRPHSRDHFFQYCLNYAYDPDATCPMFESFLDGITCGREELQKIILEFMAYGLSNDSLWKHKALFLHGTGRNGKSTLLKIIQQLCGEGNYSAVSISSLGDPQQVAMLDGKLFNIKGESGKALYDCEEFKEVTSGESLNAKIVFKPPFKMKPKAKFIVACNYLPRSYDTSDGFFGRMLLIPFDAKYKDNDPSTIPDYDKIIMENEASGILNKVCDAYVRLHKQKNFTSSKASSDLLDSYIEDNMPELQFFNEVYRIGEDKVGWSAIKDIYQAFRNWSQENGHNMNKLPTQRSFTKTLENKMPILSERRSRKSGGFTYEGVYKAQDQVVINPTEGMFE